MGRWRSLRPLPLLVAVALPVGLAAALFSLPWLGLCAAAAAGALWRGMPLLPGLLHPRRAVELGPHVALGFLAVGAAFVVADRLGVRPLGFSSEIVLLTATHFHFAGFGVLTIGCIVARRRSSMRFAILGLVIGFPVTAAAFVLASDALNALGAVIVGLAGSFVAIALTLVRGGGWRTWTMRLAGVALLLGVPMGIAWSWAIWLGIDFLGLDAMVRTHGVLNAVGVMLVALAYPRQPA